MPLKPLTYEPCRPKLSEQLCSFIFAAKQPMGRERLVVAVVACVLASAAAQAPPLQYLHIRPGFQISTFAYGVERARQLAISKANPFIVYTGSNEAPVRWAPAHAVLFLVVPALLPTEQTLQLPG